MSRNLTNIHFHPTRSNDEHWTISFSTALISFENNISAPMCTVLFVWKCIAFRPRPRGTSRLGVIVKSFLATFKQSFSVPSRRLDGFSLSHITLSMRVCSSAMTRRIIEVAFSNGSSAVERPDQAAT
jgi:hypothetical protein